MTDKDKISIHRRLLQIQCGWDLSWVGLRRLHWVTVRYNNAGKRSLRAITTLCSKLARSEKRLNPFSPQYSWTVFRLKNNLNPLSSKLEWTAVRAENYKPKYGGISLHCEGRLQCVLCNCMWVISCSSMPRNTWQSLGLIVLGEFQLHVPVRQYCGLNSKKWISMSH